MPYPLGHGGACEMTAATISISTCCSLYSIFVNYFSDFEQLIVEAKAADMLDTEWRSLRSKNIYAFHKASLPLTKVEIQSGVSYGNVWHRLQDNVLSPLVKDVMFLLLHNKLPVMERLYRIRVANDPYCLSCPGAEIQDIHHYFSDCINVVSVWSHIRKMLLQMLGMSVNDQSVTNWDLLNLIFPNQHFESECTWLIGNYVSYVWNAIYIKGQCVISFDQLFGFLKFKFKSDQIGARKPMCQLPWFS